MHKLRTAIAGILALLTVTPAVAQVNINNVPASTVVGRSAVGTGPAQAIPFSTLLTSMGAVPTSRTISTTSPLSGGGDLSANRTLSISTNGISNSLLRQSAALSLVGRSANSTGNVADISATPGSSCVFIETSNTLACGQIATAGIANNAVDNTKIRQSAALSLVGRSANSLGNVADISASAASDCVFRESGSTVGCGTVATAGIAASAVTYAKIQNTTAARLLGNPTGGTTAPSEISLGSTLAFSGTALQTAALTGDVTASANSFATSIAANAVTNAKMATMAANTVKANATGGSATPTDVTAATARSSSLLNVDSFTGRGDAIYTILATDRTVGTNAAFTASRTWTLPAANAVNAGHEVLVADYQGTVTASNTLVISRAGSDTVNGGTSVTISAANGAYMLRSDGVSKWTAQSMGSASGGGVTSVTCGTGLSGGTITTSGTCAINLSTLTNSLSGDVNLNNTANYFDGPSVAQGTSGTWFASGTVSLIDTTTTAAGFSCKLWDGTTVIASARTIEATSNTGISLSLSGYLATPAGNIRISCKDTGSTNGKILFNATGESKDSTLSVIRIN